MKLKIKTPTVTLECSHCKETFVRSRRVYKSVRKTYHFCCKDHRLTFHSRRQSEKYRLARIQANRNKPKSTIDAFDSLYFVVAGQKHRGSTIRQAMGLAKETVTARIKKGWPIKAAYLTKEDDK